MLAKTVKMTDSQKQIYANKARYEYIERELYLCEQRKQERENERYILDQNRIFQDQEEEREREEQKKNNAKYELVNLSNQQELINKAKEGFYSRFDNNKIIDYYNNIEDKIKKAKRINNDPKCKINYAPNVDKLINKQKKAINNIKCSIKKSNDSKPSEARNNAKKKISSWDKSGWYI
jgi:hypothetical protein